MDPQDIETDDWKEVLPLETPACVLINQSKAQVFTCVSDKRCITIVVFTPHVPVYFWNNRHNFGDIELKFCILP